MQIQMFAPKLSLVSNLLRLFLKWEEEVGTGKTKYPTYVYPQELKTLLRTVFPEGVCNYSDPDHSKVWAILRFLPQPNLCLRLQSKGPLG